MFVGICSILNIIGFLLVKGLYLDEYNIDEVTEESLLLSDSHGLPLGDVSRFGVSNLSNASDSYLDMERKLRFVLKHHKVKKVFLTVDDHTLSSYRDDLNNEDRSVVFTDLNSFENGLELFVEKYFRYYVIWFNPKYSSILQQYIKGKKKSKKDKKKPWSSLNNNQRLEQSRGRFERQFSSTDTSVVMRESLEAIIQLCKDEGVELIGVKFPLAGEYNDLVGELSYGAEQVFYENKLKVVDFKRSPELNNSHFDNQDHLNRIGGDWLSKKIFTE